MKMTLQSLCAIIALSIASLAFAIDLGDAKSRGLVGETSNGYLGAVQSSAEVNALVDDINKKRKERYKEIAAKNGISLEAVEARAGQKAMSKTSAGEYVNSGSGWQKK